MMRQSSAILDDSIRRVMDTCPEEEFKVYRRAIGKIMGAIYIEVMRPLYVKFPDLEPKEMRGD